jgi:hypothetical protein
MNARGVGRMNHFLGFVRRPRRFLDQIPSPIIEFDREPTVCLLQIKRCFVHVEVACDLSITPRRICLAAGIAAKSTWF